MLRALPAAGVRVTTLRGALDAGLVGDPVALPPSSWGSGKDWRVWAGEQVADLVARNDDVQKTLVGALGPGPTRDPVADALAQEALLALSSDWAFMVTKDSAADYARGSAPHARRPRRRARPPPRRRAHRRRAPPGGHVARYPVRPHRRPRLWATRQNGCCPTTNYGHLNR